MTGAVTEISLLGDVELRIDETPVPLGGAKQRAVLAMLALEPNKVVSATALMDGLWAEALPASAPKMVQNYVWQLRRALEPGDAEIVTSGSGYALRIDADHVDASRFRTLLERAEGADANGDAQAALDLWRGAPLADVIGEPFATAPVRDLEELRLRALELASERALASGDAASALRDADDLLRADPLRERAYALRMLALYRAGRQADALAAYGAARDTLVEQLGVEPGPELQRLQGAILRQDPDLDPVPEQTRLPPALVVEGPPLIGRAPELARLTAAWQRARAGRGSIMLVSGPEGYGKTRVVAELAQRAARHRAAVVALGDGVDVMAAVAAVNRPSQPTLLVIEDADALAPEARATLAQLDPSDLPVLVLLTATDASTPGLPAADDHLALLALDTDAVGELVAYFVPDGAADVAQIVADTHAVPGAVVARAAGMGRDVARERANSAAAAAADVRSADRMARSQVANSVLELSRAARRLVALGAARDRTAAPYQGLRPYMEADAAWFFGRERLVADAVALLASDSLLALVGPSGSGKSSLARAGLLPVLAEGALPGSADWPQRVIRPGGRPADTLREVRGQMDSSGIVVLDQFEEAFTACDDPGQRAELDDEIARLLADGSRVVLVIRGDFYDRCAQLPRLSARIVDNQLLVGEMRREELRRAIEQPAATAYATVEPELVEALVDEITGEPGALPLLSTALLELWERSDGRRLRLADHERGGGVRAAVARLAEAAFADLEARERDVARSVLLRLADDAPGAEPVRRRASRDELDLGRRPEVAAVVDHLAARRLLTVFDDGVEVAHEALLREWPRLGAWLRDDRESRRIRLHIAAAAAAWEQSSRDPGELYRGARLEAAREWAHVHEDELSANECSFLDASAAARERAARRLKALVGGLAVALVAALAAGIVALGERTSAREQARAAEAQRLGALALTGEPLDRSLLLARQGFALDPSPSTQGSLLAALVRSPAAVGVAAGDGDRFLAIDAAPRARLVAAGDNHGHVLFFDATTMRRVGPRVGVKGSVFALRFSPDGRRLAIPYASEAGAAIDILDTRSFQRTATVDAGAGGGDFERLAFTADSQTLAAEDVAFDPATGEPGRSTLRRWDADTGRRVGRPVRLTSAGPSLVGFTAAGTVVTSSEAEDAVVVRDARTLHELRRFRGGRYAAAVSQDGRSLALGDADGSLSIVDLRDGESRPLHGGHAAEVLGLSFTPDGRSLVTAGDDGKVLVWDTGSGDQRERFEGHTGRVRAVAVGAGGRSAFSAALDGRIIAWDLAGDRRLGRPLHTGTGNPDHPHAAVSANGRRFAITQQSGAVHLFAAPHGRRLGVLRAPGAGAATGAAFAPGSDGLAVTYDDGRVRLWSARTRRQVAAALEAHDGPVLAADFTRDGRLVTAGEDGRIRMWDTATRRPLATATAAGAITDVALDPRGTAVLATLSGPGPDDGALQRFTLPRLVAQGRRTAPPGLWSRYSADGRLVLRGDFDGGVHVLDARSLRPRFAALRGHAGFVISAVSDASGRTLATGSSDGTVRLWDLRTGRPVGAPLPGIPNRWVAASFLADHQLLASYDSGEAFVWDVRPEEWARHACRVAGRRLTAAEWRDLLPDRPYAPAC